jgi:glyoxylase-like metal-dependent hydrolase (beta-lactamase superfamily II)
VSHLHCDHAGGLTTLAHADVPVAVHANELAFARDRAGPELAYHRPDYTEPEPAWRVLEGEAQLAPGVWALPTPGHTPGHMSYRVELPASGTWLFAVDAADLGENLNDGVPPGSCADPADAPQAEASLRWLRDEAARRGARLVPGHDMAFWAAVRHPEGGWR